MEKKEGDNTLGLLSWSFGFASILFAVLQPIIGIIAGIAGLFFSKKQSKTGRNEWTKVGKVLSIIGIIFSIVVIILGFLAINYLRANPQLLGQFPIT